MEKSSTILVLFGSNGINGLRHPYREHSHPNTMSSACQGLFTDENDYHLGTIRSGQAPGFSVCQCRTIITQPAKMSRANLAKIVLDFIRGLCIMVTYFERTDMDRFIDDYYDTDDGDSYQNLLEYNQWLESDDFINWINELLAEASREERELQNAQIWNS